VFFFNKKLTEGPISKILQSAGINAKQKKVQGPMSKSDESAGTNDTFKPIFNVLGEFIKLCPFNYLNVFFLAYFFFKKFIHNQISLKIYFQYN